MKNLILCIVVSFYSSNLVLAATGPKAITPDWSDEATLPEEGHRGNIYGLSKDDLKVWRDKGLRHALFYPVEVSGVEFPYRPLKKLLESESDNPIRRWIYDIAKKNLAFKSMKEMYQWLGLSEYPKEQGTGAYRVPFPRSGRPNDHMGATVRKTPQGETLTFSCAACHTQSLFGKPVIGLFNKRPRANDFFLLGEKYLPLMPHQIFRLGASPTKGELELYKRARKNIRSIGAKAPQNVAMDTSLAQVALSLSHRKKDEYATKSRFYETFPRSNELEHFVADSKPGTWFVLKYKTRWLSDGSIISGNPIFTNFLWNEIGRGTDLKELEVWMKNNDHKIKELTAAVFASEPPLWSDFFGTRGINIEKAKAGEQIFNNRCQKCHGTYQKAWSQPDAQLLTDIEKIKTIKVEYSEQTVVKDVGTDPQRYLGMKAFADALNRLKISKWAKTVVEPQVGYVPPPLVGIWSRYPYFHNGSIPNLCALMTPSKDRPEVFYQGPSDNPETDFDFDCIGYPIGDDIPSEWKKDKTARIDTTRPGLSNRGHSKVFINEDGSWMSEEKREQLLNYLKTL